MATCKLDHASVDTIPRALCRTCHPELIPTRDTLAEPEAADREKQRAEAAALAHDKRQRRRLRAEAKRLQGEIDKIDGRNPAATAKIQAALDLVNRDLFIVS